MKKDKDEQNLNEETKEQEAPKEADAQEESELTPEEQLQAQLTQAQSKVDEYTDRWKRSMAEFDNFRKRTLKEKEQSFDRGVRDVVEKLLPVIDNFERALAGGDESDAFVAGVAMIYKQIRSVLEDLGVEEIEAQGQLFDPNLHYAVSHVEDPEFGEGTVADVFQKGYKHKDTVIRCSMVKVAN